MAIGTTQAFRTQNFRLLGNFYDKNNVIGSKGYYLNSVGDGVEWRADINEGTGILTGGVISATIGGTTFNITAGTGQILSKALVGGEVITTNTRVSWNAQNNIALTYRTSHQFSYIYIDENGVLQQQNSSFTDAEYRNKIIVGIICHIDYSTINLVTNKQNVAYNDATRIYELISCFGPIKQSGLSISAYSTDLRITRAAGAVFLLGSNYSTDQFVPDTTTLTAANPALLCRVSRDGSGGFVFDVNSGSYYTSIDSTKYDDGSGTLQTVNNNQWTIQRLYFFPNNPNDVIVYYGRAIYNSYSDASAGLSTESFSEATITAENAIFLGHLIVRGGAANLSTSADAVFFQSGAFRNIGTGSGGGGGAGATYLDDLGDVAISSPSDSQFLVYDNSTSLWKNASLTASSPITFTGVGTSLSLSVSNNAISFAKIQQISTSRVLGRISSGTGNIEELTGANIATIIGSNAVINATNAVTASSLAGGIAGVIPYQADTGITDFTAAGTAGQVLLSAGSDAPYWANQSALSVGSAATLTTTRKIWGQSFNGSQNVNGNILDTFDNELIKFTSAGADAANEITIANASASSNPSIAASGSDTNISLNLISKGTGTILINGKAILLANSLTTVGDNALTLTTTGATNVTLPTTGTLATTSQIPTVNNAILTIAADNGLGVSATPTFTANASVDKTITLSISDSGVTAAKLASNAVETAKIKDNNVTLAKLAQITGPVVLGKVDAGSGNVTTLTGANIATVIGNNAVINATNAATASSLAGGIAGVIPYQADTGITDFTAAGTAGQVLLSAGSDAPYWANQSALSVGTLSSIRTLWGQNFNGSANVTGSLTSVGNITGSSAITITAGGSNQNITLTPSGTGYTLLNGNVGIGTSNPFGRLQVFGSDSTYAFTISGDTKGVRFSTTSSGVVITGVDSSLVTSYESLIIGGSDLTFRYNGVNVGMYLNTTGNLGVGTQSQNARIHSTSTTEQLRLGYDTNNYSSFTVASNGTLTISTTNGSSTADLNITPQRNLNLGTSNTDNIYIGRTDLLTGTYNRGIFSATTTTLVQGLYQDNSANVGIGITSPSTLLHIYKASGNSILTLDNTGNGNSSGINFNRERSTGSGVNAASIFVDSNTSSTEGLLYIQAQTAGANAGVTSALTANNGVRLLLRGGYGIFSIENGASETFRIDNNGNVGIGTTNPSNTLDVNGTTRIRTVAASGSVASIFLTTDANGVLVSRTTAQVRSDIGAGTGSGTVTSITTSGGLTGGTITSTGDISISDGGVTVAKLASNAVETAKIKDNNVTLAKLAQITGPVVLGKVDAGSGNVTTLTGANIATVIGNNAVINAANATNATTASHLAGGIAGVIPYQADTGITDFTAAGTAGQVLLSAGSDAPYWANQSALSVGSAATLTTTRKIWGQSFNGSQNVNGNILDTHDNELIKFTSAGQDAANEITIANASASSNPSIAASGSDTNISLNLISKGTGVILINGKAISLANSFTTAGNYALTLTTTAATNVTLPTTGTLATTSQIPTVNNAALTIAADNGLGVSATPTFTANASVDKTITLSISDSGVTAAKLASNAVETAKIKDNNVTLAKLAQITGPVVLGKVDAGSGNVTTLTGANIATVIGNNAVINAANATNATTASHLAGGIAGVIPYQADTGITDFTAAGTAGQVLLSAGSSTPYWADQSALSVGTLSSIRTLWGQNFNGSANVTGSLSSVGNINGSGSITVAAGGTNQNITLTPSGTGYTLLNGKVGIGTTVPTDTLDVNGTARIRTVSASGSVASIFLTTDANGVLVSRTVAQVRSDIGAGTGSGTVTSVTLATNSTGTDVGVTNPTVTTSGTITLNIPSASATARGVITTGAQTIAGTKTFSSTISGSIDGNAGTVTNGVYTTGNQTIAGVKTFSDNILIGKDIGLPASTTTAYGQYSAHPAAGPASFLELIESLSNAIGVNDPIRFRSIITPEKYITGAWSADASPPTYSKLIDGNATSEISIISFTDYDSSGITARRFTVDLSGGYRRPNFITIQSDYGNNAFYGYSVLIEKSTDNSTWTNACSTQTVANNTAKLLAFSLGDLSANRYLRFTFTATQAITASGALKINRIRSYGNQHYGSVIPVYTNASGHLYSIYTTILASTSGSVGVGTISPVQKLHVESGVGNPATSGTSQNGIARLSNTNDNAVVDFGMRSGGAGAWIQSTNKTDLSTNYPLLLNPNGGNVGIGISSPVYPLQVRRAGGVGSLGISIDNYLGASTRDVLFKVTPDVAGDTGGFLFRTYNGADVNAMTILAAGNVGIGITAPSSRLHLHGTAPTILTFSSASYPVTDYNTTLGVDSSARGFLIFGNNAVNEIRAGRTVAGGFLDFYTNNTVGQTTTTSDGNFVMRMAANGNVGIGLTTPGAKLEVLGSSPSYPASSGTTQTGHIARFTNNGSNLILDIGGNGGNGNWLQSTNKTDLSLTYSLLLNPNGGNVGIGTTSPAAALHVKATNGVAATFLRGSDPLTAVANAYIYAPVETGFSGVPVYRFWYQNCGLGNPASETLAFYTNNTEKVRLQSDGNVGIGGTSPDALLHVATGHIHVGDATAFDNPASWNKTILIDGSSHARLRVRATAYAPGNNNLNEAYLWVDNSITPYSGLFANYGFRLQTGNGSVVLSPASGNVGIGTTSPAVLLHLGSSSQATAAYGLRFGLDTSANLYRSGPASIKTDSSFVVAGTLTELSALRYKENIAPISNILDKVCQIQPISYNKKGKVEKEYGVIAEEVNELFPELISRNADGDIDSVNYSRLTVLLIQAVKELKAEVEKLKNK